MQAYDFSDLATRAPGFQYQQQSPIQTELNIRGIGTVSENGSATDPSVATFEDEIYIGRMGSATTELFDIERIEVLRGPQGTLYGKNVVGGAISLYTARPKYDASGQIRLGYGNYDTTLLSGYVTGRLAEGVAGRLSFHYRQRHDGYSRNVRLDREMDTFAAMAVRAQLLFDISSNLTLLLRADRSHDEGDGQARRAFDDPFVAGIGPVTASYPDDDVRKNYSPDPEGHKRNVWSTSARLEWDTPIGSLTSITSYRDVDARNMLAQFGTTAPPLATTSYLIVNEKYSALSQELRLASSKDRRVSWIIGLYYLRERTGNDDSNYTYNPLWVAQGPDPRVNYHYVQNNQTQNVAAFGQATWNITDDLGLTVGARYTEDKKNYDTVANAIAQDGGVPSAAVLTSYPLQMLDAKWKRLTPRVSLQWQATPDVMLYASANNGFKGGGWQGKPASAAAARSRFNPEIAWSYEAGAKTQWFDNRLRANVALFHVDYKDLQVRQTNLDCICLVVSNAGNARIRGIEVEAHAAVTDRFDLWASGSLLDAKYVDFVDTRGVVFSGNLMQRTPKSQYSVGGTYTVPLGENGKISMTADYSWQGKIFWTVDNTTWEPAYGLLGARVTYTTSSGNYRLSLWAKNLTDELYRVRAGPLRGDEFSTMSPPRFYGLELSARF